MTTDKVVGFLFCFVFTRSAQFSGDACFNLGQKDQQVPFSSAKLLQSVQECNPSATNVGELEPVFL